MSTVTGWWWCKHRPECHPAGSQSRRHPDLIQNPLVSKYAHIILYSGGTLTAQSSSSSGWNKHAGRHICKPSCYDDFGNGKEDARRHPTNEEFVKYAGLLWTASRGVEARATIAEKYKEAWARAYPNHAVRLIQVGHALEPAPEDFFDFEGHPALKPLPRNAYTQATASSSGSADQGQAPSMLCAPVTVALAPSDPAPNVQSNPTPMVSLDRSLHGAPAPISPVDPPFNVAIDVGHIPPSNPAQVSCGSPFVDNESLVPYLRQHSFKIKTLPFLSQIIGGLVPGFKALTQPTTLLHVVFVELPDQRLCGNLQADETFLAHTEVDIKTYNILNAAVPLSLGRKMKAKNEGGRESEHIPIIIASSLLLAIEMLDHDKIWDVTIVDWEHYRDTLVTMGEGDPRRERLWVKLVGNTDLIVGGLNLASDFVNMRSPFAMSSEGAVKYCISSFILSTKTTVWVNPDDLHLEGQKQETNFLLTECARSLGFDHPVIVHVKEQDLENTVKELVNGTRQGVLKRSLSGGSQHVITPHTEHPLKVLKHALNDQKKFWTEAVQIFTPPHWFLQPYMPLMLYLGELRTFIANGVIYHIAYTTPTELATPAALQVMSGHVVRPLRSFGYDPARPTDPKVTGWLHVEGSDNIDPADFVGDTFHEFVLNMAGKMVLAEEKRYQRFSGLRIFGRFDVSVYRHAASGMYKYVVNEVTRGHNAHLFHGHDSTLGSSDHFISILAKLLHYTASNKLNHSLPPSPP